MRAAFVLLVSLLVLPPLRASMAQVSQEQATAIRQLLASTFEKPGSALSLDPIVVEGDGAVVGWIQGDMAGRAFLRNRQGTWTIVACGATLSSRHRRWSGWACRNFKPTSWPRHWRTLKQRRPQAGRSLRKFRRDRRDGGGTPHAPPAGHRHSAIGTSDDRLCGNAVSITD